MLLLPWIKDFSQPRTGTPSKFMAALEGIVSKMWPHRAFWHVAFFPIINGYVFHLGLATVSIVVLAPSRGVLYKTEITSTM